MPVTSDLQQRMMELVAKIETENEQAKFTALVHELNELLEGKARSTVQPPAESSGKREPQAA